MMKNSILKRHHEQHQFWSSALNCKLQQKNSSLPSNLFSLQCTPVHLSAIQHSRAHGNAIHYFDFPTRPIACSRNGTGTQQHKDSWKILHKVQLIWLNTKYKNKSITTKIQKTKKKINANILKQKCSRNAVETPQQEDSRQVLPKLSAIDGFILSAHIKSESKLSEIQTITFTSTTTISACLSAFP